MQVSDPAYQEHRVFSELERSAKFYQQLATSVFSFATMGTKSICNIDTYVYSSMQETIESIMMVLLSGRIGDAYYALLRKYYDSTIINIYANLYLKNNFSIDNFVVEKIYNWLQGTEKIPEYRIMSQYIKSSGILKPVNDIFNIDERYKLLRGRCNDYTHYNLFQHVMLNDNEVYLKNRGRWLERLAEDISDVFVHHLSYMFFLNDHYMMSSDYLDALECNMLPEESSQYWVAPFVQDIFDEVITPRRREVTALIKTSSAMQLS